MSILDYKDKIVCASKYFSIDEMIKIYNLGIKNFGENYPQSLLNKKVLLKDYKDIKWHLIGNLQTNKVKMIINEIDVLETLHSIKLANLIEKHRIEKLDTLIQVNLSDDINKHGVLLKDLDDFIKKVKKYDKINLIGLMTIGILNDDVKTEFVFKKLNELNKQYNLKITSMGMSADYKLALKHESNILRIGSLFKEVI